MRSSAASDVYKRQAMRTWISATCRSKSRANRDCPSNLTQFIRCPAVHFGTKCHERDGLDAASSVIFAPTLPDASTKIARGSDRIVTGDHPCAHGFPRFSILTGSDLPPKAPSFITRVCGSEFRILRRLVGQACRARSPQVAQASGTPLRVFDCRATSAV